MRKIVLPLGGKVSLSTGALAGRAPSPIESEGHGDDSSSSSGKPSPPPSPPSFWAHFGLGNPPSLESPSTAPHTPRSPSVISTVFSHYSPYIPEWEDVEAGCSCSPCSYSSLRDKLPLKHHCLCFRDKYEEKAKNPASAKAINYDIRVSYIPGFLISFVFFLIYCFVISVYWSKIGLQCGIPDPIFDTIPATAPETTSVGYNSKVTKMGLPDWANVATSCCFLFIIYTGYANLRSTRDRMERLVHCLINIAYSFLKEVNPASDEGNERDEQQRLVYECMALCAAFPIAMLQRNLGRTCEPAVARYCREAAAKLQVLRAGGGIADDGSRLRVDLTTATPTLGEPTNSSRLCVPVDNFFEIFCIQLQQEYERQRKMTTTSRPLTMLHITYALRCHYENLTDLGAIDDRRGPAIGESIELMSNLGREIHVCTMRDVTPTVFLYTVYLAALALVIWLPIENCSRLINTTLVIPSAQPEIPTIRTIFVLIFAAIIFALLLTIVRQSWHMWNSLSSGVMNTDGWTLGIAMELDALLNQFYETDPAAMIRKHSYMPSRQRGPKPGSVSRWVGHQP